ncbi:sulfatase [Bacteroidota bacterium]
MKNAFHNLKIIILFPFSIVIFGCVNNDNTIVEKTNILYIMSDDHAVQAVSSLGSRIIQTPNIDRLAKEGVRFENSFVTNSICAPSRAVLLTGKHSHINGVRDNRLRFDGTQLTFPKLLQKAGYETAMVGKWHLKSKPTGFNHWEILRGQGEYYNPFIISERDTTIIEGYVTDIITDLGLNWLKDRTSDKPFCLLLHHKAPHRNWMPSPNHHQLFRDIDIPVPDTYFDDYDTRSAAAVEQEMEIATHMRDGWDFKINPDDPDIEWDDRQWKRQYSRMKEGPQHDAWDKYYGPANKVLKEANLEGKELALWKYQRYIKDYLKCIVSIDENVGRVLDYLDNTGLSANTLVVYTSDQGFYLGEHGWFDKRFMYEESLRMPLLMKYPEKIKAGSIINELVQNLDFAPTFLDLAGLNIPDEMQGKSLLPLMYGQAASEWRNSMYYHYYEYPGAHSVKKHYGIRTDRYKLIHFYYDIDAWELYDLQEDPKELNNIIDDPENSKLIKELKNELSQLQKHYNDTTVNIKR